MKMKDKPLKVCYFGTYRAFYSRNQIMIAALRSAGVEVVECHVNLWHGISDRVHVASGGWASVSFIKRILSAYFQLLKKYFALEKDYDVMVLGYPGQLDVFLARLLTWVHRKKLVLDLFMSVYLISLERGLKSKSRLSMYLLRMLESVVCRLPDLLICDTKAYVAWHGKTYGLRPEKFRLVPTGADDRFFKPSTFRKHQDGIFRVFYYGTYIPNHGVETMIEAANLLKDHPHIQFELAGKGETKSRAEQMVKNYDLTNVVFRDWIEKEALTQKIAQADVLLGVFGTTPQSLMTIQNKVYEGLAMGKPIITGYSETIASALEHKTHVYLVERANPQALAEAILTLYAAPDLRDLLSKHGHVLFTQKFSIEKLGEIYKEHLVQLCLEK